jgi:hypothetical protein
MERTRFRTVRRVAEVLIALDAFKNLLFLSLFHLSSQLLETIDDGGADILTECAFELGLVLLHNWDGASENFDLSC